MKLSAFFKYFFLYSFVFYSVSLPKAYNKKFDKSKHYNIYIPIIPFYFIYRLHRYLSFKDKNIDQFINFRSKKSIHLFMLVKEVFKSVKDAYYDPLELYRVYEKDIQSICTFLKSSSVKDDFISFIKKIYMLEISTEFIEVFAKYIAIIINNEAAIYNAVKADKRGCIKKYFSVVKKFFNQSDLKVIKAAEYQCFPFKCTIEKSSADVRLADPHEFYTYKKGDHKQYENIININDTYIINKKMFFELCNQYSSKSLSEGVFDTTLKKYVKKLLEVSSQQKVKDSLYDDLCMIYDKELVLTAYHEVAHFLVATLYGKLDSRLISIKQNDNMMGYVWTEVDYNKQNVYQYMDLIESAYGNMSEFGKKYSFLPNKISPSKTLKYTEAMSATSKKRMALAGVIAEIQREDIKLDDVFNLLGSSHGMDGFQYIKQLMIENSLYGEGSVKERISYDYYVVNLILKLYRKMLDSIAQKLLSKRELDEKEILKLQDMIFIEAKKNMLLWLI